MNTQIADNRLEAALLVAGLNPARETYAPRTTVRSYRPTLDRPPKLPDPLPPTWTPGPNAKLLLDLEPDDCRFPVGDDTGVDQLFCGNDAHHRPTGYCPECAQRVLPKGAAINPKVLH